ncbi:hypothetical protein [Paenibacillus campinasensis]|uniref:Uncharacterized protein n=1 Tax=Paenibacillus campinasensis TaxID=66347 RepID=A0A268EIB4_9BACL|nr:hypothetical protein [Paenibacillus campinasensis]PAD72852.1 hypothetical protein CHH67_21330 [Paenibacillus campinasensis]
MRKRQRKKNEKLYVKLYPVETSLLFMSHEERQKSIDDYLQVRRQLARKPYRELKKKRMIYVHSPGVAERNFSKKLSKRIRKTGVFQEASSFTAVQSAADFPDSLKDRFSLTRK